MFVQEFILSVINAVVFAMTIFFKSKIISPNQKINIKDTIIALAIYIISFIINVYNFTPLFTIFFYYISIVIFQKIVFKQQLTKTLLTSLIIYCIRMLMELILIGLGFFHPNIIYATNHLPMEKFLSNICSGVLSVLVFILMKKLVHKLINKVNNKPNYSFVIFTLIYFSLIIVFIIRMPYMRRDFDLIYDIVIIVLITIITGIIIDKENQMDMMSKMYIEMSNYAKLNAKLMDEYRITLNERENNLTEIMTLFNQNKRKAQKYLEELINQKESITSEWLKEFNNIPISGMKGFINFKMIEMKNIGIKPEILVSPSIKDLKKMQDKDINELYTVLGILLDNAISVTKNSKDKMVSIQMYEEQGKIHITIANSFEGQIAIDKIDKFISKISSKKDMGLIIVKNIINNNDIYNLHTEIFQNFFVQDIIISI